MNSRGNIFHPDNFKYYLIGFILLCSLKFYTVLIPKNVGKAVVLLGVAAILLVIIIYSIYARNKGFSKRFLPQLTFFGIALIISVFAADYFHDQSIGSTLLAQYDFYFFAFYFLLHLLKPHPDGLLKFLVWLGLIYSGIYLFQYVIYPNQILSSKVFEDRGTIRIFMPGAGYMFTAWFILLSKYFITKKAKYLLGLIPLLLVVFLLGTRQVLASIVLLTILNVLLSKKVKSKILVFAIGALAAIPIFFLFQDIFMNMTELSKSEGSEMQSNIRVRAAYYYLFEFNRDPLWVVTGNGVAANGTAYGNKMGVIMNTLRFYQSDIGLIGDFVKLGILLLIGQLSLYFKLLKPRYNEKYSFIRYSVLSLILTMFSGSGLTAYTIGLICMMMYIMEVTVPAKKLNS